MEFRSGNPMLSDKTFEPSIGTQADRMTLDGTVNKTGILLLIVALTSAWPWSMVMQNPDNAGMANMLSIAGAIIGLVLALVISFKPHTAPYLAPIYAAAEGLFLGAISAFFELRYPGIALQAVALTLGTMATLLLAYKSGLIRATENFKLMVISATGAICLLYLVSFIMSFFGTSIPFIHQGGVIGIGFSLLVVSVAALNLVLDFDFIENGVNSGAPKHMEWYGAFSLTVTLVWLYIEFLRLLSKLRD
ncbi:putative YccA/Bax inhibitor family protein [Hydromonas duriensis]|uniref:Putative YccA/Bax inhibitor family protein n=2 Tax=Hydromonas duriensis TaxID=1527608 RepID=A0A4R6Y6M8_9BURK|nr:putative YccA/Bax inhibitor family protein [Hydromonas duriensis]